jgi:hypothetical protein
MEEHRLRLFKDRELNVFEPKREEVQGSARKVKKIA